MNSELRDFFLTFQDYYLWFFCKQKNKNWLDQFLKVNMNKNKLFKSKVFHENHQGRVELGVSEGCNIPPPFF